MLVDDIVISLRAGRGGDGAVAFNKNLMSLGPVGGSGGRGGSIYFEGVSDLSRLNQFRFKKIIAAPDGGQGRGQFHDGADGQDIILSIPVGTVIRNQETGAEEEIIKIGDRRLAVHGGRGGRGNFHFRSPINTSPKEFEKGEAGEAGVFRLELKLIADIGLIGLPNAGKSSLLNELTNAKSRVANYPFTTLEPNLGAYYDLILADIPGLIEGAAAGRGLGIKFLRHIERTGTIFHLISAESEDVVGDYRIVRKELKKHSRALEQKKEIVLLTKIDLVTGAIVSRQKEVLQAAGAIAEAVSVYDDDSLERVKRLLNRVIQEKTSVSR